MKKIALILIFLAALVFNFTLACGAELQLFIHYDVEIDATSFMPEEPVIIQLIASNPDAMNDYYHNISRGKAEKKIKTVTLGAKNKPWTDSVQFKLIDSKGKERTVKFSAAPGGQNQVILDAENAAERYFFIAPDETRKLPADDYTILASIDKVTSKALKLKIIASKQVAGKAKIARLLKFGRYNLLLKKFAEAQKYAEQILAIDALNLRGMNLLGDAQTGLGKYKEAYATFQKAIKEFFRQYPPDGTGTYEPPQLLIDKAYELKKKL